jgi:hypothetical protein
MEERRRVRLHTPGAAERAPVFAMRSVGDHFPEELAGPLISERFQQFVAATG